MNIITLKTGKLGVNTYIVYPKLGKKCIVIDAGGGEQLIADTLEKNGLTLVAILLTHGHFDHIGAVKYFQDLGAKIYINEADNGMTENPKSYGFPQLAKAVKPFTADAFVACGDVLKLAGLKINVISTPGHTRGGVCYKIGNALFTGDTLFRLSVGRSDLEGGDYNTLISSIKNKLFCYSNLLVYPGHEEMTELELEKAENPYLNEKKYDNV